MKQQIVLIHFFLFSILTFGQNLSANTTGSFTYTPSVPLSTQLVEVFYHIPNGDITTMPIVMSFHGANRNADDYRDYWISMANANNFMVFAPEFSTTYYPNLGDDYLMANIFDDGDNPTTGTFNNQNEWTFSILDPLFDYIKADILGTQEKYNAWGHSGGAQFLHRFVMYMPNSNLDIAVCSNAGWYTVPESIVSFPYGTQNGQLPITDLTGAFSKKLIVHLGQNDTDENSAGLRHNTVVDNQQGLNRYVRGQYFYATSQTTSTNMSATFNWEKHEVSGVGHNAQNMANDALQYVLMSTLSTNTFSIKERIKVYPNPTDELFYFDNSKLKTTNAELYSIDGRLVDTFNFSSSDVKQEINLNKLVSGIYFLNIDNETIKIIKK